MKILLCETWSYYWYGEVLGEKLSELGVEVIPFREGDYFQTNGLGWLAATLSRFQSKYRVGWSIARLNRDLLARAYTEKVDCVLCVRGDLIFPNTLRSLKNTGITVAGLNNDNPFGAKHPPYKWRLLKRGLMHYDLYFAYRHSNIQQFIDAGCQNVALLRSFYIREKNRPIPSIEKMIDVVFVGHWEPDGRDAYVAALLAMPNLNFKIYGSEWGKSPLAEAIILRQGRVEPIYNEEYNIVLNQSKIALVFLSGLNQDTYTRRVFEITAAQTMMLSQYTEDLDSLFHEDLEAVYFRSPEDLAAKVAYFVEQEAEREKIARTGYLKVMSGGHEAMDRARQILKAIREVQILRTSQ